VTAKRKTLREVRAIARAERDLEIADFVDDFAALIDGRPGQAPGLAASYRGFASSLRAGLVE
jgi:hypothetical protein